LPNTKGAKKKRLFKVKNDAKTTGKASPDEVDGNGTPGKAATARGKNPPKGGRSGYLPPSETAIPNEIQEEPLGVRRQVKVIWSQRSFRAGGKS